MIASMSLAPKHDAPVAEKFAYFLSQLQEVQSSGDGYKACCPAHPDDRASLSVQIGEKGIVATCHAGCTFPQICHAVNVTASWMFERSTSASTKSASTERETGSWIYTDESGNPLFRTVRIEDGTVGENGKPKKTFRQQAADGKGGWKNSVKNTRVVPYRLAHVFLNLFNDPVLIVEGEKHCDRLAELGFIATCNAGGAAAGNSKNKWRPEHSECLRGSDVIILPDNDKPGREHAQNVAKSLEGIAASVKICILPGLPEKGDVIDWLDTGGTKEELQRLLDAAVSVEEAFPEEPSSRKSSSDGRTEIQITPDEHIVVDETLNALMADDNLYKRNGQLFHVVREMDDVCEDGIRRSMGTPRIHAVSAGHLRERMTQRCYFYKQADDSRIHCSPPASLVNGIHTRGFWPQLRNLAGVTEIPVLRPDGSILTTPGWDESTGLLYVPNGELPQLKENPTHADAVQARDLLLDVVADFPFASPAHQSAWLAGLLTVLARRAFNGPAPMFLIDANIRGSGKSLLTDVISLITTSRSMPRFSNPESEEESRKRITSLALAGDPLILIDNINSSLGSASLDAVLTSTSWKDRRLGGNEIVEMPMKAIWFGTGNNVILAGDMSRRICHIRLDSLEENPEERSGFRHPKLLAHVREHRMELLAAGLTLLRAFIVAGSPSADLKPWGSFEGWSDLIRNCVVWCGMDDPGGTRKELAEASDRDAGALRMLFDGWADIDPKGEGLSALEMTTLLDFFKRRRDYVNSGMEFSAADRLIEKEQRELESVKTALCELCGVPELTAKDARKLGNQLRRFKGRVIGDQRLECRSHGRNKVNKWQVKQIDAVCTVSAVSVPCRQKILKEGEEEITESKKRDTGNENNKRPKTHTAHASHTAFRSTDDNCPMCGFDTDQPGEPCLGCRENDN
ncbi:hypothetical protein SH668x_001023 [Planctomicrobium sp. SH668]|uniref:hypothetical protein n=1 Tax=Planctomicrobium sp. SH668 TaxID=3448126 RepID=UPI003F5BD26B